MELKRIDEDDQRVNDGLVVCEVHGVYRHLEIEGSHYLLLTDELAFQIELMRRRNEGHQIDSRVKKKEHRINNILIALLELLRVPLYALLFWLCFALFALGIFWMTQKSGEYFDQRVGTRDASGWIFLGALFVVLLLAYRKDYSKPIVGIAGLTLLFIIPSILALYLFDLDQSWNSTMHKMLGYIVIWSSQLMGVLYKSLDKFDLRERAILGICLGIILALMDFFGAPGIIKAMFFVTAFWIGVYRSR